MTNEENMQMQDAVRNGVITYEQYIDWLRQADPDGRGAPSREYFNAPAAGSLGDRINSMFGGLGGNGLADFVRMIGAVYGQNPYAPAQQMYGISNGYSYTSPYSQEQLSDLQRRGLYAPTTWSYDQLYDEHGNPTRTALDKAYNAQDTVSGWSPYASTPQYLSEMNTLVGAMNAVNNGTATVAEQSYVNDFLQQRDKWFKQTDRINELLDMAKANPNDTHLQNLAAIWGPQQQAYGGLVNQFRQAVQNWQPNPGYGTSWKQTPGAAWQGMADWLQSYNNGQAQFGGGNFGGGNYKQNFADMYQQPQKNQGWTPYNNNPNNWQPNPQYQTQPYPSGGGTSVGYGQPYIGKPAIENDKPQYLPVANGAKGLHSQQGTMPARPEPSYRSWARR